MPDLSTTLTDAYAALTGLDPPAPVLLAGDPDPDGEQPELIILQDVSSVQVGTYGLDARDNRIQITCYAQTKLAALGLEARALAALRGAGFRFLQSRPAPAEIGQLSEYRR